MTTVMGYGYRDCIVGVRAPAGEWTCRVMESGWPEEQAP